MCLQCMAEANTVIDNFIPGYFVMISTKDHPEWPIGKYALVRGNNPDVIFPLTPVPDTEAEDDDEFLANDFLESVKAAESAFSNDIYTAYLFADACKKAGYDPDKHGTRVMWWFMDKLGLKLQEMNCG